MKSSDTQKSQVDKFKEAAREFGTDEREDAFDRIVKKIAKAQPSDKSTEAKKEKN